MASGLLDGVPVCPVYPPIDALVLEVHGELKLVVLDKGERDLVQAGYVFEIFRGSEYKGRVRIISVQDATSTGLILVEKKDMAKGDSAATRL